MVEHSALGNIYRFTITRLAVSFHWQHRMTLAGPSHLVVANKILRICFIEPINPFFICAIVPGNDDEEGKNVRRVP